MTANLAYCGAPTEEGTALIITRGSRLIAEGTAQAPIVFTSDNLGSATAPQAGDWGGVVLLGSAPNNLPNRAAGQIEGLAETNGSGQYGGDDVASSCGTLRFVRIEYAGYRYGTDNELNSLTLGSCGSGTVIEFLQAHRGLDDGIEFFGGSANAKYIVITGTGDDSLDYDQGYSGNVQFYIAQQLRVAGEDRCIEADGNRNGRNNMPYSNPQIYNFTCIGAARPGQARTGLLQDGAIFRDGSAGTLRNSIFVSAPDKGITVQHNETLVRLPAVATPRLLISNNIVTGSGPDGMSRYFDLVSNTSTNRPQNEQMMIDDGLVSLAGANRTNVDPGFAGDVYNETAPNFRLTTTGAASQNAAATPTDAFFTAANYLGAVDPANIGTAWYELWTRFGN